MSLRLFLLVLPSLITLALGFIVLLRNPKSNSNRVYALLNLTIISWLTSSYLTDTIPSDGQKLIFAKMAFYLGYLSIVMLYVFIWYFPKTNMPSFRTRLSLYVVSLILLLISIGNGVVGGIEPKDGLTNIIPGNTYIVFLVGILYVLLLAIHRLRKSYKSAVGITKDRIRYVLYGSAFASFWGVLTNVVLISVLPDLEAQNYAPLGILVLATLIAVSIVRHKLFDIKLVIARTAGYALSIGFLAIIYGVIAFNIIDTFIFDEYTSRFVQQSVYTLLAILLAFTFQPLKKFFDRLSNKIFYQDAYDAQVLIDDLNRTLVSTIEVQQLLSKTAQIISQYVKTEYVFFVINEINNNPRRIIGTKDSQIDGLDIDTVRSAIVSQSSKSVVTDSVEEANPQLFELLRKNDVAVLIRLTDSPSKKSEGIGYMVLGNKKSGSPFSGQDIKVLEIIADELVIAIQNALRFEEIKNFNITLQEKVDDATKKLRDANKRLIELDQTKDDFISMASHQLRTPLTSIKGYVSMVMEGDAGKITKKQSDLLGQSFNSAQRMVYLIADLLNVSRLRTGKFVIEAKKTNLAEVIDGEMAQLKETAKARNLELTYKKPTGFPELMLDETKIRQVIMNFIDNAIYYTPKEGHITVNLEDKGENIEFTVVDDGIGVPKTVQHNLFNKFYRADNAKKARPDGTGLGLFMAKKVVVAQGGSIIFKSTEGKGSTFGFSFNKKPILPENFKGVTKEADK